MDAVAQHLEFETRNLISALDILVKHFRHDAAILGSAHQQDASAPRLSVLPGAGPDIHEARRSLIASMSKLHWLLDEPAEFMQNLIIQVSQQSAERACIFASDMKLDSQAITSRRVSSFRALHGWRSSRYWPTYLSEKAYRSAT